MPCKKIIGAFQFKSPFTKNNLDDLDKISFQQLLTGCQCEYIFTYLKYVYEFKIELELIF